MSMTEKPKIAFIGGDRGAGKMLKAQMELLEELESYRAIGTVSEFAELKEKATAKPKKIVYVKQKCGLPWICPDCGEEQIKRGFAHEDESETNTFCWKCGIVLDWREGKE